MHFRHESNLLSKPLVCAYFHLHPHAHITHFRSVQRSTCSPVFTPARKPAQFFKKKKKKKKKNYTTTDLLFSPLLPFWTCISTLGK